MEIKMKYSFFTKCIFLKYVVHSIFYVFSFFFLTKIHYIIHKYSSIKLLKFEPGNREYKPMSSSKPIPKIMHIKESYKKKVNMDCTCLEKKDTNIRVVIEEELIGKRPLGRLHIRWEDCGRRDVGAMDPGPTERK